MDTKNTYGIPTPEGRFDEYIKSGREVILRTSSGNFEMGIIKSVDRDDVYLSPAVVYQSYANGAGFDNVPRIETELPVKIRQSLVSVIAPLSEGYMDKFVADSVNQDLNKKNRAKAASNKSPSLEDIYGPKTSSK